MDAQKFKECIVACNRCIALSQYCSTACLQEDDVKMMAKCIHLDMQCAAMCTLAVNFMCMNSAFIVQVCQLCAEVCRACAQECGRFKMDHCQRCAEACNACADKCMAMAA